MAKDEDYTLINATRMAMHLVAFLLTWLSAQAALMAVVICSFLFASAWTFLEWRRILYTPRTPWISFIPATFDAVILSIFMIVTGNINSILASVFLLTITVGSMNIRVKHGEYALCLAVLSFAATGVMTMLGIVPRMNLLGGGSDINWVSFGVTLLLFCLIGLGLNRIVRHQVKQEILLINRLERSEARNDDLLRTIFPAEVVQDLKAGGISKPVFVESVSVLYAEISSASNQTKSFDPEEFISLLNIYVSQMDLILGKYGIEKMKIVGEGYMCVSGAPAYRPDHAKSICLAAKEIMEYMNKTKHRDSRNPPFDIRIGINSGPVCAGMIGASRFSYDIWGDVINLANRLVTASEPNKINISRTTCHLIEDSIPVEFRGFIQTKNGGSMEMYYLKLQG